MPALQKGSIRKSGSGYAVRYRDEHGKERRAAGFKTPTAAQQYVRDQVDRAAKIKRGEFIPEPETPKVEALTFDELCDGFLDQHVAEAGTIRTLKERLKRPRDKFGDVRIDAFPITEARAWFAKQPEGYRPLILRAMRQVFGYAVECKMIEENPAQAIKMPTIKREPVEIFDTIADVRMVGDALDPRFGAMPLFVGATGLRPEEWIALERADIDRAGGFVDVCKVYVDGQLKQYTKTNKRRRVPLTKLALEALAMIPARIDTPLLFPGRRGGYINLDNFRNREWNPAVESVGLAGRTPYSLRHSYCSWLLAAGVPPLDVAKFAGTSLKMLSETYGHLMPGADDRARDALDSLDAQEREAAAK